MNFLIGILLPSVIGIKFFLHFNKQEKFSCSSRVEYYLIFLLTSNTVCVTLSKYLFGLNSNLESSLTMSPLFSVKYIILSIIINVIVAIVLACIKKYFILEIEVEKEENNRKKVKRK